jgi:DNA-binding SARP family transcriptional activator/predicted ATPase
VEREHPVPAVLGSTGEMHLQLLGAFAVSLEGRAVGAEAFPRRKAHQLVKLLALQPRTQAHREQVIEALWPHLAPDSAAHQLHNALAQARATLRALTGPGTTPLVIERGVVSLRHPGGVSTDVGQALAVAAEALAFGTSSALERSWSALELPLLPDERYEPWCEPMREAVRATAFRVGLALAEASLAERRLDDAVLLAEGLVREEPTEEAAYRLLMRAAAEAGDPAGVERVVRRLEEALERELGAEPGPETVQLHATLRGRFEAAAGAPGAAPLPVPRTPFVGRSFELAEIDRHLSLPGCRLLTLTGIGGIGKTRLALEAARRRAERSGATATFIEVPERCSEARLGTLLSDALAPGSSPASERELATLLHGRLLVLDNAEHALDARSLLARLLGGPGDVVVIAASRQRLQLQGERVLELQGLEVPRIESRAEPERFGAVRLFLDAAERSAGTRLAAADAVAVARICRLLHGVPLALELAAAWVGVLSCDGVVDELERGLDLLVSSAVDIPERHRSLRHAFEGSYRLLTEEERRHLAALSVFAAPCSLDAARSVTQLPLQVLRSLRDKALVTQPLPGRCTVHPVVRQFAAEKLRPADAAAFAGAHARYYLARLAEWASLLDAGEERRAVREVVADVPNVRAAFLHAVGSGDTAGLDAALDGLAKLFDKLGWHREGFDLLEAARSATASRAAADTAAGERLTARIASRSASFAHALGQLDVARDLLERSRSLLAQGEEPAEEAAVLDKLSLVVHDLGDDAAARALLREALALRRRSGDPDAVATSLNNVGSMAFAQGDLEEAARWVAEALELQRRHGATKGAAISLQNLASIEIARGDAGAAERHLAEGLALARSIESASLAALFLTNLARLALQRGDVDAAGESAREALASALDVGAAAIAASLLPTLALLAERRGELAEAVALCSLALRTPTAGREVRAQAEALLRRFAGVLAPAEMAAAQERGAALRLADLLPGRGGEPVA